MKIDGLRPEVYAGLWGNPKTEGGRAMYDVSSEHCKRTPAFWAVFIGEVLRIYAEQVEEFNPADVRNVWKLYLWAVKQPLPPFVGVRCLCGNHL